MQFKQKSSSMLLSLLSFILLLSISMLYFVSIYLKVNPNGTILSNNFYNSIKNIIINIDYTSTIAYFNILVFYSPVLIGILALFGKLLRIFNILPVISFTNVIIGYIAYQSFNSSSNKFLDFTSNSNIAFSCIFLIASIGFVTSLINLIKSK